jgi:hypothetical protein
MKDVSLLLVGLLAVAACDGTRGLEQRGPDRGVDGSTPEAGPDDVAGSPPPPMLTVPLIDTPTYGTRLTSIPNGDESVLPGRRLYDNRLQSTCRFDWAADGQLRCLPTQQVRYFTPTEFSDPQCSKPVVVQRPVSQFNCGTPPPATLAVASRATCPISYAMHRLGPRVAGNHFEVVNGVCQEVPGATAVFEVGEAIAPTEFVSAVRRMGEAKGGIAPVFLDADDGSRLFRGWHLPAEAKDCGFGRASDGKLRCVPAAATTVFDDRSQYGDELCTTAATSIPRDGCGASTMFVHRYLGDICGERRFAVHRGLAKHENVHARSAAGCARSGGSNGTSEYLSFGPEVAPGQFVEGQLAVSGGSGRLKHLAVVTPAGAARTIDFWDDQLGVFCDPTPMADGATRCVPIQEATSGVSEYFTDDRCSSSLVLAPEGCATARALVYQLSSCQFHVMVFGLTPRSFTGPVYRMGIRRCELAGTLGDLKMRAFDAREIPAAEFARFDGR